MQVRGLLHGQGWYDLRQYRMNPPGGANIHWSRLVDLPIAGLILPRTLALIPAGGLVVAVTVAPLLRWRSWRWDVQPEAIQVRHGVLRIRHTVVPMVRVQHVDTTSGLLEQVFDLYSVEIHTAADSHKIPLLEARDADEVRRRIEALTDES